MSQADPAPERTRAWLTLLDAALPSALLTRLLAVHGSPDAVAALHERDLRAAGRLTEEQLRRWREAQGDQVRRERQLELLHEDQIRLLEPSVPEWPTALRDLDDAPPVLFLRGHLLPTDHLSVAIVGPRRATPYGEQMARLLASELAPVLTVLSGCALGIDSVAHKAALDAPGGRTVGVMACGLDQDYPQGNAALRARIAENGALVSVWPPLTQPATYRFPERNRLLAALCLGVIVVEAGEKSGTLLTAGAALDFGKEVFAVPGDATRANSLGSNQLLRDGARPVTCGLEVLEDLAPILNRLVAQSPELQPKAVEVQTVSPPSAPAGLNEEQRLIYEELRHAERDYDGLLAAFVPARMSSGQLATALLQLELKKVIHQRPGKVYGLAGTAHSAAS